MYYESRKNTITDLTEQSLYEQIVAILKLPICSGVKIGDQIWVNDESPYGTGLHKVAVLYTLEDKTVQFESITVDDGIEPMEIGQFINAFKSVEFLEKEYGILTRTRKAVTLSDLVLFDIEVNDAEEVNNAAETEDKNQTKR